MDRKRNDRRIVGLMIAMYCRGVHGHRVMCSGCRQLLAYASERVDRCPLGDRKRSCRRCMVHCYAPERRQQIRSVMRYAGPRMLWRYPGMALRHLWHELRY